MWIRWCTVVTLNKVQPKDNNYRELKCRWDKNHFHLLHLLFCFILIKIYHLIVESKVHWYCIPACPGMPHQLPCPQHMPSNPAHQNPKNCLFSDNQGYYKNLVKSPETCMCSCSSIFLAIQIQKFVSRQCLKYHLIFWCESVILTQIPAPLRRSPDILKQTVKYDLSSGT